MYVMSPAKGYVTAAVYIPHSAVTFFLFFSSFCCSKQFAPSLPFRLWMGFNAAAVEQFRRSPACAD